jgi:hypothetical protein
MGITLPTSWLGFRFCERLRSGGGGCSSGGFLSGSLRFFVSVSDSRFRRTKSTTRRLASLSSAPSTPIRACMTQNRPNVTAKARAKAAGKRRPIQSLTSAAIDTL